MRQSSNEEFKDVIDEKIRQTLPDGTLPEQNFTSLDLRFSNSCNFKCRTCSPNSSTAWYEDFNQLTNENKFVKLLRPTKAKEDFINMLDPLLSSLNKIYIAGGEPLLEQDHYTMLDTLIKTENTDISLNYNTNFSAIKLGNKNIFDYWKHFKNINIYLSYDGFGEKGEYIRSGMNWEGVVKNHRELQTHTHIKFYITPTISVLNAFHMPEFLIHLINENLITNGDQIGFNILHDPAFYNISIFTSEEKIALKNCYNNFIQGQLTKLDIPNKEYLIQQLEMVINYTEKISENNAHARKKFLAQSTLLDKLREEKLLALFPELIGFYQ